MPLIALLGVLTILSRMEPEPDPNPPVKVKIIQPGDDVKAQIEWFEKNKEPLFEESDDNIVLPPQEGM